MHAHDGIRESRHAQNFAFADLRHVKFRLYTKDRAISKYQHDTSIQREFANEIEFNARIWKAGLASVSRISMFLKLSPSSMILISMCCR
jgi:hypothetical protein